MSEMSWLLRPSDALPTIGLSLLVLAFSSSGCEKPQPEENGNDSSEVSRPPVELPAVPSFEIPAPYPDGTHSVREVLLKSPEFVGSRTKIKGFVVWIYDCAKAIRTQGMTDADIAKLLAKEPDRCARPNFIIGDEPDTPSEKGALVVGVPRALRPDERRAPTESHKEMAKAFSAMPKFAVGDQVLIEGEWNIKTDRNDRKSEGLLIYGSMQNLSNAPQ